jgi:CheY-like chemotaxis protein/two-component sensor histidine kinase
VKSAEILAMVGRQVEQLKRLIDDLLDASRISRGKIELRKEKVSLAAVIQDAIDSVKPFIEANAHTLSVTLPEESVQVYGDKGRLMQVFGNLLHNAAKYTEKNGNIWISSFLKPESISISIRDNGSGIPHDMLTSIFDPFTQVQGSLDRAQGGLGIGLTLVKALIDLHGGTVEAKSEGPGHGSEFIVKLPLAAAAVSILPSPSEKIQERESPTITLTTCHRILIVDDVKPSADTLAMILEGLGQNIRVAYDGISALKTIEEFNPDIIFSDIAMPGMDGYSLAERVRRRRGNKPLMIALTGYGQKHDSQRALESGFNQHLVKPASLGQLKEILTQLSPQQR